MALRMKEDPDDVKVNEGGNSSSAPGGNDMGEGFIDMTDPFYADNMNNPTYVVKSANIPKQTEKASPAIKILILAIIIVAVCIGGFVVYKKYFAIRDLTADVKLPESEIAAKYGLTFVDGTDDMVKRIPRYTQSKVTVRNADNLLMVYVDGKKVGVSTDASRYSMFNVKIGDPAYKVKDTTSFRYDETFDVLNDMEHGNSTVDYYANWDTNECLALTVNDGSGRVVAIAYYSDLKKMTEDLVFDEQ